MSKIRLLITSGKSGIWNMALDEALLRGVEENGGVVYRLFDWDPWCITLGHFQQPGKEVDIAKARAAGFDVVRRFTGGRGVLHSEELTYSAITPMDSNLPGFEDWMALPATIYSTVSQWLADGINRLGAGVSLERGELSAEEQRAHATAPCFSSTARFEVVHNAKKLIGSAQRRTRTAMLQHGSILMGKHHLSLVDYLHFNEAEKKIARRVLQRNAISLSEILQEENTSSEALSAETLKLRVRDILQDELEKRIPGLEVCTEPRQEELERTRELEAEYMVENIK